MKRNVAGQVVLGQLNAKSDGTAVTTGTTTCYVTGDAGTQAAGSVGSGACTHEGEGLWSYAPAQAETDYANVCFTFVHTDAVTATVQIYPTFPQTGDSFTRLGAPVGASLSADLADGVLVTAMAITGGATIAGGLAITAATNGHALTLAGHGLGHGAIIIGGSGGNGLVVSGDRGVSITGVDDVGIKVDGGISQDGVFIEGYDNGIRVQGYGTGSGIKATGGDTGHGMHLVGGATSGDGLHAEAPTDGSGVTTTGAGSGFALSDSTVDAIFNRADGIETGLTLKDALRLIAAATAGKLSGGATTTITIRNAVADGKDRIIATVDADGNRSAITYDLT